MVCVRQKTEQSCRWRRRKEDRPAEILAAALIIFTKKGYAATKLDEVARAAGVSKGTVYLYFESKEAILKAVVSEFVLPHIAKAEEQAEQYTGSIKDLMYTLFEQWRINVLETDLCGIPKIMISEASNFPELATFYLENVILRARKLVANLITLGITCGEFRVCNTEYVARIFLASMVFTAIWEQSLASFDEPYDIEVYLNTNFDIFMRGLLKDNHG